MRERGGKARGREIAHLRHDIVDILGKEKRKRGVRLELTEKRRRKRQREGGRRSRDREHRGPEPRNAFLEVLEVVEAPLAREPARHRERREVSREHKEDRDPQKSPREPSLVGMVYDDRRYREHAKPVEGLHLAILGHGELLQTPFSNLCTKL